MFAVVVFSVLMFGTLRADFAAVHPEARIVHGLFSGPSESASQEGTHVDVIVDFVDGSGLDEVLGIGKSLGATLSLVSDNTRDIALYRASVPFAALNEWLSKFRSHRAVEFVEPDIVHYALGFPNDPLHKHQWHLDQINMKEAWEMADGSGVTVAVVDTGVAYEDWGSFKRAEDLAGTKFVPGYDFVNNNKHPIDDNGHGTHVAGTIAQTTNNGVGVAGIGLEVQIMPLKVLSGGGFGSAAAIAAAIRYAADHGARVINMSLGSPMPSYTIKQACDYAHAKGVAIVCAAGNSGRRGVGYPARFASCIGVSATRFDEQVTFYSTYGPGVDLAAPGGDTRVDQNGDGMPDGVLQNTYLRGKVETEGYHNFMGTSMACPHVAGVAALLVGRGVTDPEKIRSILTSTARPKGQRPWDEKYGAGILDAPSALRGRAPGGSDDTNVLLLLLFLAALVLLLLWLINGRVAHLTLGHFVGALVGSCGIAGLVFEASSGQAMALLTHSIADWDYALFGWQGTGSLLARSALICVLGLMLLSGIKKLRPFISGLSLGMAAFLGWAAYDMAVDLSAFAGTWPDRTWLFANAVLCFGCAIAIEILRKPQDS